MKLIISIACLLTPYLLQAQSIDDAVQERPPEVVYYWLVASPTVQRTGEMRLRGPNALVVKSGLEPKKTLRPDEVINFRVGQRKYISEQAEVTNNIFSKVVKRQFVEQLDSGQVMLTRTEQFVPNSNNFGGSTVDVFLLRGQYEPTALQLHWNVLGLCPELRDRLRPFLTARPDLEQALQQYRFSPDDLRAFIHALNSGQPFSYRPDKATRKKDKPAKERLMENPFTN